MLHPLAREAFAATSREPVDFISPHTPSRYDDTHSQALHGLGLRGGGAILHPDAYGLPGDELSPPPPEAFFLCIRHEFDLNGNGEDDGGYVHLRVDTGELCWIEICDYLCSPDCDACRD